MYTFFWNIVGFDFTVCDIMRKHEQPVSKYDANESLFKMPLFLSCEVMNVQSLLKQQRHPYVC